MIKRALIIGSEGQDGRLLSEFLIKKGYQITGLDVPVKSFTKINYISFDLNNYSAPEFTQLIKKNFSEIYYLAAFHNSSADDMSVTSPYFFNQTMNINVNAFVRLLQIINDFKLNSKVFYASSSLIFSKSKTKIQNELTIPKPGCLYSMSKNIAGQFAEYYKKNYNLFISVGILYNHESHLRTENFLSKKIVSCAKRIKSGIQTKLIVGDLSAQSDWGYAPDYVEAFYEILQLNHPENFIISTGKTHTVLDWIEITFKQLEIDWTNVVFQDNNLIKRKKKTLVGDNSKITRLTKWKPTTSFKDMISYMLQNLEGL